MVSGRPCSRVRPRPTATSCALPRQRPFHCAQLDSLACRRPLYRDPNAPPGSPVSRHHAIGHDETTGVTFICGGKWSTYRAMAEELVDKVIAFKGDALKHAKPCTTREIKLLGGDGYHTLLHVQLVQNYGVKDRAERPAFRQRQGVIPPPR